MPSKAGFPPCGIASDRHIAFIYDGVELVVGTDATAVGDRIMVTYSFVCVLSMTPGLAAVHFATASAMSLIPAADAGFASATAAVNLLPFCGTQVSVQQPDKRRCFGINE